MMSLPTHGHVNKIGYRLIFWRVHLAAGQQVLINRLVLLACVPIQRLAERSLAILIRKGWHFRVLVHAQRVVNPAGEVMWIQPLFHVLKIRPGSLEDADRLKRADAVTGRARKSAIFGEQLAAKRD